MQCANYRGPWEAAERRPSFPWEACTRKEMRRRRRCQPCNKLRGVPKSSVTAWSQRSCRNGVELKVISPRLKTHYLGITCPWEISALSSSPGLSTGRCPIAPTFSSPSSPSLCLNFHCTCCQTVWIYPRPGSPSTTCFCSPPGKPVSRGQGSMLLLSLLRAGFLVFCSHACHFCQKPWCESKPFNL